MLTATLIRDVTSDVGTFGVLRLAGSGVTCFQCQTAELPWRENRNNVSCIPVGRYRVVFRTRGWGRMARIYEVQDVPGRSGILIHYGNWAGDESLGLKSDVEGCILVGEKRTIIEGQMGVTKSFVTLDKLHTAAGGADMMLEVSETFVRPTA